MKVGSADFILKCTKLDTNESQWGILVSFRFCTKLVKVRISDVLILLCVTVRFKNEIQ